MYIRFTVLCKSNASEFRRISWLFIAFRRNFPSNESSATFPRTFEVPIVFTPPDVSNDNSRWTLTSQEISRESLLFSIVSREIAGENSLWLLSVLIQTKLKQNTTTVRERDVKDI